MGEKQKLSKEMIKDAVSILSEYESPETFFSAEVLQKRIETEFDATVDIEDVKPYVRIQCLEAVDRYLTLKNIGL